MALVPIEPTAKMILDGESELRKHDFFRLDCAYRTMIAAAQGDESLAAIAVQKGYVV